MCSFSCDRLIKTVEDRIEKHKQDFRRSPEFIVLTREYYECFICYQAKIDPGSDIFVKKFQGISLVLIFGHDILELAGRPSDMYFYELNNNKSN